MNWKEHRNFKNLILGKSLLNIGDSFFTLAISIALVSVYNVGVADLSVFALTMMLPRMMAFLYGPYIDKVKNKKNAILLMQFLHILVVVGIVVAVAIEIDIVYIYVLNIIFSLVNVVQASMQVGFVPQTLEYDENLINKSIDIQYFTSNTLDIISNFVVSVLLGFISYLYVMEISVPIFIAAMYFFYKISIKKIIPPTNSEELLLNEEIKKGSFFEEVKEMFKYFKSKKRHSFIVVTEAVLSGVTDMLLALIPIYLIMINLDIKWLGLVMATQRLADFLGALIAPFVKMEIFSFFAIDYVLTGTMFTMIFLVDNIYVKLGLYFFSFLIIGISGNFFEKMIYDGYDYDKLSGIHTIVSSLYSFFAIIFLIVPIVYEDIIVLGVSLNIFTVIFGLIIFTISYKKKS